MVGLLKELLCFYRKLKFRRGEPNLRPSTCKNTGRRDDCHGGLLFPPERGEHGPPFPLAQVEAVSGLPDIRLNASDETGAGLDFVDQASVVIAHVIDSATDWPGQ